jgi:hypothetical protein
MSRLDELPPDQRAALSLLLRQRKSYGEVALLLGISERAVHDRAHAAIAVLAPREARVLPPERRAEIADYLLGQQRGVAERLRTRTYLGGSEPARAWAHAIASELASIAGFELPEIPAGTVASLQQSVAAAAGSAPFFSSSSSSSSLSSPPAGADGAFGKSSASSLPSSRVGGAILLAVIVAAIVVAVVLLSGGGSSSSTDTTAASSTKTTSSTTTSTSTPTKTETTAKAKAKKGEPTVEKQITLKPSKAGSGSIGVVDVLVEKGKRAFYIAAEHLPETKGFFYAVWLYNSHTSAVPLSKAPSVGSSHRLAGGALLPTSASKYREILLTREKSDHPTHPGPVVLRGAFSVG